MNAITRRLPCALLWCIRAVCALLLPGMPGMAVPAVAEEPREFVSNEYFTLGSPDDFTVAIKLADFDGDGDLDALMINGRHWARPDLLMENNGDGRFLIARPLGEAATGYSPALGDLDGDGHVDIVVARDRIPSLLYMSRGNGGFDAGSPVGRPGPARAVESADVDGDNNPDLVFSLRSARNYVAFGPRFERLQQFGDAEQSVRIVLADFDGDGHPDIAFTNLGAEGSGIYYNDGRGLFGDARRLHASLGPTVDVAAADFDGDGLTDVAFASIAQSVVFLNDSDHRFSRHIAFGPPGERSYGIAAADLDGDGDVDIAVANDGEANALYFNEGNRFTRHLLTEDPGARSYGVSIGDLNGDGYPDLVYANSGSMSRVYLNASAGTRESLLAR